MHQSELDCGRQEKENKLPGHRYLKYRWRVRLNTSHYAALCILQPFMKLWSAAMKVRKGTSLQGDDFKIQRSLQTLQNWPWWRHACVRWAVNLTVSEQEWSDPRRNEQLCKCNRTAPTHSSQHCPTNLFCQQIRNRGKQRPTPPHRQHHHQPTDEKNKFTKTIRLSLTYIVKSHAPVLWWLSAGKRRACLLLRVEVRQWSSKSIICSLPLKQRGLPSSSPPSPMDFLPWFSSREVW